MMGATVTGESASDLLKTVSVPEAYASRLKALKEQAEQAKGFAEQAREANIKMEASRKEAEDLNTSTIDMMDKINAKEAELQARETKLADGGKYLDESTQRLEQAKADWALKTEAAETDIKKRLAAVAKAEGDFAKRLADGIAEAKQDFAERKAALEAAYKDKEAAVAMRETEAAAKSDAAAAATAEAKQSQLSYESKLAELKKLVSA